MYFQSTFIQGKVKNTERKIIILQKKQTVIYSVISLIPTKKDKKINEKKLITV